MCSCEPSASDPHNPRAEWCTHGSDVAGIAGEHHNVASVHRSHRCTDVGVGGSEPALSLDSGSEVRRRRVEDTVSHSKTVDRGSDRCRSIPARFDAGSGRHDDLHNGAPSAPGDRASKVSEHCAVLWVRRLSESLHCLVVKYDRPHATTASCASAHNSTSSASASGRRATTADAAEAIRSGRSASGDPS